jgi:hypothetical protein
MIFWLKPMKEANLDNIFDDIKSLLKKQNLDLIDRKIEDCENLAKTRLDLAVERLESSLEHLEKSEKNRGESIERRLMFFEIWLWILSAVVFLGILAIGT